MKDDVQCNEKSRLLYRILPEALWTSSIQSKTECKDLGAISTSPGFNLPHENESYEEAGRLVARNTSTEAISVVRAPYLALYSTPRTVLLPKWDEVHLIGFSYTGRKGGLASRNETMRNILKCSQDVETISAISAISRKRQLSGAFTFGDGEF